MNIGQVYASRKNFVENGIGSLMTAKEGFESIKYARSAVTDREYVRIRDIFGNAVTIEITGDDPERIFSNMCRYIVFCEKTKEEKIIPPSGIVTDKNLLIKIAPLFA